SAVLGWVGYPLRGEGTRCNHSFRGRWNEHTECKGCLGRFVSDFLAVVINGHSVDIELTPFRQVTLILHACELGRPDDGLSEKLAQRSRHEPTTLCEDHLGLIADIVVHLVNGRVVSIVSRDEVGVARAFSARPYVDEPAINNG